MRIRNGEIDQKTLVRRPAVAAGIISIAFALSAALPAQAQDDGVVARVNGEEITERDLATAERIYESQLGDMAEDARRSVLVDALIDARLVANAARAEGIADSEEFKSQLAFFEEQTLGTLYTEQAMAQSVPDTAVRAAYDSQIASMPGASEKRVRHILVADEARAQEIIASLQEGASFDDLARSDSLDGMSKDNGGDLGYLAEGRTLPEIEAAIGGLQPGEVAEAPVRSAFGFHVVKLEEERTTPPPAFESVEPQIRRTLENAAQRELMARLRETSTVEKLVPDVTPEQPDDGHQH